MTLLATNLESKSHISSFQRNINPVPCTLDKGQEKIRVALDDILDKPENGQYETEKEAQAKDYSQAVKVNYEDGNFVEDKHNKNRFNSQLQSSIVPVSCTSDRGQEKIRIACPQCTKEVKDIKQHIKQIHGNFKETECPKCSKVFAKAHLMRHHLKEVH